MSKPKKKKEKLNRYEALIEKVFFDGYTEGATEVLFVRTDLETAAEIIGIKLPKNLGDVLYSPRHRTGLPERILATQPQGLEWVIDGVARSKYAFRLVTLTRIRPSENLVTIAIPDATPEVIRAYALDDEQALLAIVRYNRLIDTFLGLTTYSLQNHLRTTVNGVQIEIDELYVGLDKHGCHYIIPVQAKGGSDQIGIVQATQDVRYVTAKFPGMRCKPIAVQFMKDELGDVVAMFELIVQEGQLRVAEERHYRLVPHDALDREAIRSYRD
jgi:hypothetical protein